MGVQISEDVFGEFIKDNGEQVKVKRFTWTNGNGMTVQVITYGATITSLSSPDKNGKIQDLVTGFNTLEEYESPANRYFGATIGRYANRIAKGRFNLDGAEYYLAQNNNGNALHGGIKGFDKVIWTPKLLGNKLELSYKSKDMEEGYPGDLHAIVWFELTENNEFKIEYKATSTKSTIVNMTNHSYFNLAGIDSGATGLYDHEVTINADKITEVDQLSIPTGKLLDVTNTSFDLRKPTKLQNVINKVPNSPGFDHNFCVNPNAKFVAKVWHPASGRQMEVTSSKPGVQFYTANFLPEDDSLRGKAGFYKKHGAFCLETQFYPDSINHASFPSPILKPGEVYNHTTTYKFTVTE